MVTRPWKSNLKEQISPTTEKIAPLNLKRQNVITFSSSNRVLKTQWVESVEIRIIIFSSFALTTAKEIEALVEARVNSEARTELEIRLREVEEREAMQVQALWRTKANVKQSNRLCLEKIGSTETLRIFKSIIKLVNVDMRSQSLKFQNLLGRF